MADIKQNIRTLSTPVNEKLAFKLIESWSLSGKLRSTAFIHKLANKGMVQLNDTSRSIVSPGNVINFCSVIDSVITVMNRMYDKNWDFHVEPVFENGKLKTFIFKIKILFPEIIINNSENESHTIKNLIVCFNLKRSDFINGSYCPSTIYGTRASLSFEEWFIGYNHSHLTTYQPKTFSDTFYLQDFCTGSNTEINNVALGINEEGYTEELFELYLYTINTLVAWESIEGTPYKRMNGITPVTHETYKPAINPNNNNLRDAYSKIDVNFSTTSFNYCYNDNRFRIKQDLEFSNYVKDSIIRVNDANLNKNYIVKQVNTTMYGYSISEGTTNPVFINRRTQEEPYTIFQGRRIYFKLAEFSGEIPDINEYKTHPKLLDYVANKLEQQLFYNAVRKSTIERQHQSSNA